MSSNVTATFGLVTIGYGQNLVYNNPYVSNLYTFQRSVTTGGIGPTPVLESIIGEAGFDSMRFDQPAPGSVPGRSFNN